MYWNSAIFLHTLYPPPINTETINIRPHLECDVGLYEFSVNGESDYLSLIWQSSGTSLNRESNYPSLSWQGTGTSLNVEVIICPQLARYLYLFHDLRHVSCTDGLIHDLRHVSCADSMDSPMI